MKLGLSWLLDGRSGPKFLKEKLCVHILGLFSSALPLATVRQLGDTSSQNQNRGSSKTKAVIMSEICCKDNPEDNSANKRYT